MIVPIGIGIGLLHFFIDCWMCFFGCMSWRVCGGCFKYLGILGFIFIKIILGSETLKSPARLWYKIYVVYMDHTKITPWLQKKV